MVDGGKKLEALKISMEKGKAKVEVNGEDISSCGSYLRYQIRQGRDSSVRHIRLRMLQGIWQRNTT